MFKSVLQSRWFTVILVVLIGFLLISFIKIEPAFTTLHKELGNLDKKIMDIQESTSELERLGDYIKSDAYLERQARLKLNYKKPDEKVVYIYTQGANGAQNNAVLQSKTSEVSKILESELIMSLKSWWWYLINK